jgi:mannose-6-phosphate isomerase-like protein (cupin superfamily)
MNKPYIIRNVADVAPVPCPCGQSRRIITEADNELVSVHRVTVSGKAKPHYHERLTEYYVILEGSGVIVLNDERIQVRPDDVIMIPPGTRHALEGEFEIINIVCPPFDAADEHLVTP